MDHWSKVKNKVHSRSTPAHTQIILKNVSPLAVGVFESYNVLKYVIKAIKVVLGQFILAKQSCNMPEQLVPCKY